MSLDIQNSSDLIKQINDTNIENRSVIGSILTETGDLVRNSDVKFNEELQKIASNVSSNMLDFKEYKKNIIKYILLAEKLLYPERKQDISDAILTTGDLVYNFIPEKLGMSHINK